jgi:hypothetical protein
MYISLKKKNKVVALTSDGDVATVSDSKAVSDLEKLVKDRKRIGQEISDLLKKNGVVASHREETEVIDE